MSLSNCGRLMSDCSQSREVVAVGILAIVVLIGFTLWIHVRQVLRVSRARREARLAERDRIARDMHDTLLQSTEGLILKVYTAARQLPLSHPTRAFLMRSVEQAEELAIEGRQKLLGLRQHLPSRIELSQALRALGLELCGDSRTTFNAVKKGRARDLSGDAWDEIFSVARESINNAIKHASAEHIEAVVTYGSSRVTVLVRDDGCGLPRDITLPSGRPGHFGLRAMGERANQLRAELMIDTEAGRGTTVSLVVPGRVAYRRWSAAFWLRPIDERSLYRGIVEMHAEVKNAIAPDSIRQ